MQQRLIAMVNDKAYFLAAVSHDLRTPLTRMRLRLERLPDDEHRQRLRQNITQMDDMIGQVLDYLRAGSSGICSRWTWTDWSRASVRTWPLPQNHFRCTARRAACG